MAAGLPIFVFVLLALPALRLWRIPARERGPAERTIAAFFLASGAGFAMRFQAIADGAVDRPLEIAVNLGGHLALSLSCVALLSFTRRLFRPHEAWARALAGAGSVASLAAVAALFTDAGAAREDAPSLLLLNSLRTLAYGWSFAEALRWWSLMRRRRALGLAEPLVANRFLLWSIWSGGLALCFGFVLIARVAGVVLGRGAEMLPAVFPWIRAVLGVAILASACAIWLCFFPPQRYRAWVGARAARAQASAVRRVR